MRFSIIVPVYNVQEYLKECLDSIVNQDFSDFEIILVNDGSTDESAKICEQYAEHYQFIRYYSKENGGLSDARNFGIDKANGQYCVFIDSDDWIAEGSLKKIDATIGESNVDLVVTKLIEVYPDGRNDKDFKFAEYMKEGFDKERALSWNFLFSGNPWPAQKTIAAREVLYKTKLRFLKGRVHEDLDWTSHLFLLCDSFVGFEEEWYYHRLNRIGSITSTIKAKNIVDTIEMAASLHDEFIDSNDPNAEIVLNQIMRSVYQKINQIYRCSVEDRKLVTRVIDDNKRIFNIAPTFKYKVFAVCIKVLGTNTSLNLLMLGKNKTTESH